MVVGVDYVASELNLQADIDFVILWERISRSQHQGGATPTMGTDGSPHGGTPARESHARSVGCGGH